MKINDGGKKSIGSSPSGLWSTIPDRRRRKKKIVTVAVRIAIDPEANIPSKCI